MDRALAPKHRDSADGAIPVVGGKGNEKEEINVH